MRIKGPVWIESKPEEGSIDAPTIYIQFVSYDNKEMDYKNPHHAAEVMNAMLTPKDIEMIGDKDPSIIFPTIATTRWKTIPKHLQKSIETLKVFGEDTIIVRRHWTIEGDDIVPVIVSEERK